ncbi:hypothetical protein DERF_009687 [Dermatophagoides farinae]|uniref:Uncharacterized protein n=1 Tax=Dermatophagoides farinae TaxID=6954 RepID=A0A922HZN9_DERFA|nr:hypothetical protein DERF_009687 [Dermatophagoides farinae]
MTSFFENSSSSFNLNPFSVLALVAFEEEVSQFKTGGILEFIRKMIFQFELKNSFKVEGE